MTKAPNACHRISLPAVFAGCFLVAQTALSQNLLLNPGFDIAAEASAWTLFGGAEILEKVGSRVPSEAWDGKYSLQAPAAITGTSSGASQSVATSADRQLTFSGFVLNSVHNELRLGCYGLARIEFLSGLGEILGTVQTAQLARVTGDWVPFSVSGIAPEGTSGARLSVLLWKGTITDAYGALYFDGLSAQEISPVPELGTGWIAAVVAMGAAVARNRWRTAGSQQNTA